MAKYYHLNRFLCYIEKQAYERQLYKLCITKRRHIVKIIHFTNKTIKDSNILRISLTKIMYQTLKQFQLNWIGNSGGNAQDSYKDAECFFLIHHSVVITSIFFSIGALFTNSTIHYVRNVIERWITKNQSAPLNRFCLSFLKYAVFLNWNWLVFLTSDAYSTYYGYGKYLKHLLLQNIF